MRRPASFGAGPGTAKMAAVSAFPTLRAAALVEPNPALLALARQFGGEAQPEVVRNATQMPSDIAHLPADAQADLVVASYALTEIANPKPPPNGCCGRRKACLSSSSQAGRASMSA